VRQNGSNSHSSHSGRPELGLITHGSLQTGLKMKLAAAQSVEDIRAGKFVVIDGARHEFFAMITDASLEVASPAVAQQPPVGTGAVDSLMREIVRGNAVYATIALKPLLMRRKPDAVDFEPVKTVPEHFSRVSDADADDVAAIFGREDGRGSHFSIGSPLDMEDVQVCLDLKRFAERSNGIFGKSGTGKSFLTRICLSGLLASRAAVNLVFDMHNEHGIEARDEVVGRSVVRGLKEHDEGRVAVFTLDPARFTRYGSKIQSKVTIPYDQITVDDVLLLADELNLTQTAAETTYLLERTFGSGWLGALLNMSDPESQKLFCKDNGANEQSLSALYRKLSRLVQECRGFLVPKLDPLDDAVKQIMACLTSGKHVVLEFGNHRRPLQYMLVANIITRSIHEEWTRRMDAAMFDRAKEPHPLVITIEEAHKFLSPALARQTIFGTIAREMRKYNVTLLIVDQRPSGIDDEVLSQLGTRITCLLSDERDIVAVLTGVSGASELRGVLASLDTKQQALVMGHAVPMPVVVRTRDYDSEDFRQSMGSFRHSALKAADIQLTRDEW
jgi:DNA helicase HerA-like ATPase